MTIRAAIYARYSSDKQNERSAEDQARLCQQRADAEGWTVTGIYPDLALSGATRDRPGLNALLRVLDRIDVVLAESIDRISRDQEDIANIWKRLRFAGVRLVTLSEGDVGELHVGLGGTIAALYLKQLGEKTRRGQLGRVEVGRIPGGLSYGYRQIIALDDRGRPDRGRREIIPEQAAIVRRIFDEFLAGRSPRAIAQQLNRDGVPGPNGGKWGASTIYGNPRRGTGILHNALYDGRIVYNRQRFEKHPETRKRIARPNPPAEWKTADVPELAIVARDRFAAAQAHIEAMAAQPVARRVRPKLLLSGLMRCGLCGGGFTVLSNHRWGCSGAVQGRDCDNRRTISTMELERRVLGAMRDRLLHADLVMAWLDEWERMTALDRRALATSRQRLERAHARAQGQIDRLVDAIADGRGTLPELRARMTVAAEARDRVAAELAELGAEPVVATHPAIAEIYRRQIGNLTEALRGPEIEAIAAREAIRALIDSIEAMPRAEGNGLDLTVTGSLAAIMALTQQSRPLSGAAMRTVALVAGTGFSQHRTLARVAA